MRRAFYIIMLALISTISHAQSIADLTRQAEEEKNPLHKYTVVYTFKNGLAEAVLYVEGEGAKHGVVDEEGHEYVSFIYDNLDLIKEGSGYKDNVYRCTINDKCGLVNSQNTTLLSCEYSHISQAKGNIWKTSKNGKYGYILLNETKSVTIKIPCLYSSIGDYTVSKPIPVSCMGKKGLIDSKNNIIVPLEFDEIATFNDNGVIWVEKNGLYGFYDKDGQQLQPCNITELYKLAATGDKQSLAFGDCPDLTDNYIFMVCDGRTGLMDGYTGNTLLPCVYDHLSLVINGKLFYKTNGKWGIVSQDNQTIQQAVYDRVEVAKGNLSETHIPNGLLRANMHVSINKQWGMLRMDGTELIPVKYDSLGEYSENMIVAEKTGKYGYIDNEGKESIPFIYFSADDFSDGLAAVKNEKGKYLFINKAGEIVIKPHEYDKVDKFADGTCKVYKNNKVWEIDKEGKKVKDSKRTIENTESSNQEPAKSTGKHSTYTHSDEGILKGLWDSIKRTTKISVH